jgi:hypothetical protein
MRKRLIVGGLGIAIVVAGLALFAAFTAQIVNLEAHVEKEIELAPCFFVREGVHGIDYNLDTDLNDRVCIEDPRGGDFGVVIPQEEYDKFIELTLSSSFRDSQNQEEFGDVHADILWECKQFEDERDLVDNLTGGPGADGFPDCRLQPNLDHNPNHPGGELDGLLRDYARVLADDPTNCLEAEHITAEDPALLPLEKLVEFIGHAELFDTTDAGAKCFYTIRLLAPPCEGEFNPFTDPNGPDVETVPCHFVKPTADPQTWEHFADIGDDFKVQVTYHSLRP